EISIAPGSKEIMPILEAKESGGTISIPQWLETDLENLKGKILRLPEREDIQAPINEQIIVELYSK
ncbi:MAG: 30S ribosomal protein S4, partial [Actinomycetia bacterium]|nr:30S ribosomal protein S4 [Actinomycetes bacterium]